VTKKAGLFAELANVVWSAIEEVELFEGPAVKVADVAVEQVGILEQGADVVGFAVERAASTQLSSPLSAFVAGAPAGAWFMAEYLCSWQVRRCVTRCEIIFCSWTYDASADKVWFDWLKARLISYYHVPHLSRHSTSFQFTRSNVSKLFNVTRRHCLIMARSTL
jgi:hypothetical protein